jgi:hypothetical protein
MQNLPAIYLIPLRKALSRVKLCIAGNTLQPLLLALQNFAAQLSREVLHN